MVKRFRRSDRDHFCLTYLSAVAPKSISPVPFFRKRQKFIRNRNSRISGLVSLIHQKDCLAGTGGYAHTASDTHRILIDSRERRDMISDLNAVLRAGVLTRITGDILSTLHDRMDSDSVDDSRESFNLFVGQIPFRQKRL